MVLWMIFTQQSKEEKNVFPISDEKTSPIIFESHSREISLSRDIHFSTDSMMMILN